MGAKNISIIFGYPHLPLQHSDDFDIYPSISLPPPISRVVLAGTIFLSKNVPLEWGLFYVITLLLFLKTVDFPKGKTVITKLNENDLITVKFAVCFILAIISSPLLTILLMFFALYRFAIYFYLRLFRGERFLGLLKGSDVMWVIENPESKSIINALLIIDVPITHNSSVDDCGQRLLELVRDISEETLLADDSSYPKLRCTKKKCSLGYYYWEKIGHIDTDQFVRSIDVSDEAGSGATMSTLRDMIGKISNESLPLEDTAMWEILVGRQPLIENKQQNIRRFPIIFRVHHTVGDGVALLQLLVNGIADKENYNSFPAAKKQKLWSESRKIVRTDESTEYDNDSLSSNDFSLEIPPAIEESKQIEPEVILKAECKKSPIIHFRRHSMLNSPLKNIQPKANSTLSWRPTFRLTPKTSKGTCEPQASSIGKLYAPIRGLQTASKSSNISWIRRLSGKSTQEQIKKEKSTCVVLPQTREKKRSTENPMPATVLKSTEENQVASSEKNPPLFQKCETYRKDARYENVQQTNTSAGNVVSECSLPRSEKNNCNEIPNIKKEIKGITRYLSQLKNILKFIYITPYFMFHQLTTKPEDTILYGKKLTGRKVVSWLTEPKGMLAKDSIRNKIRRIRNHLDENSKFTEILFTCLSRSLSKYYDRCEGPKPSTINLVLPARVDIEDLCKGSTTTSLYSTPRIRVKVTRLHGTVPIRRSAIKPQVLNCSSSNESSTDTTKQMSIEEVNESLSKVAVALPNDVLENKFTVGMLELPIEKKSTIEESDSSTIRLLQQVQESCRALRASPALLANYWLLRWIAHLLPITLLRPFLGSAPCSLVLSNLPGPEETVYVAGRPIRDIVFWVPNRGMNGVGISMLSYRGKFSFGVIADEALIPTAEDAHQIIHGVMEEIDHLEWKASSQIKQDGARTEQNKCTEV